MQAPPGKTVDDEIFFAVYSTYFGGIQFMQKTEPFFWRSAGYGKFHLSNNHLKSYW